LQLEAQKFVRRKRLVNDRCICQVTGEAILVNTLYKLLTYLLHTSTTQSAKKVTPFHMRQYNAL